MADQSNSDPPAKPASKTRRAPARAKKASSRRGAKTSGSGEPPKANEPAASSGSGAPPKLSAKDLLEAANSASATARNAWLGFVLLLAYLLVTLAGVTHKDLLLNSPVRLPIVGVEIPLFTFFIAAPVLLILVHLGLLVQHALLAHKLYHFSRAVAAEETAGERDHPLRLRLHNYTFSQLLAGPRPPPRLEWLMRRVVFMTIAGLPLMTLLYFQIKFLPYHDVAVTYWHRLIIVLDLLLIFAVRRNIGMQLFRDPSKMIEPDETDWQWRLAPRGYWGGVAISGVIVLFSWFIATVPDGGLDRLTRSFTWLASNVQSAEAKRTVFGPTAWLFEGDADHVRGQANTPLSWSRNLIVTDEDLVPDKDDAHGEVSLSLRGRDLRYAVLDRSDLHRADLTAVDLRGASLGAARLQRAKLGCADPGGGARGSNGCTRLEYANLHSTRLQGAELFNANLQGALLFLTNLQGAYLRSASLQRANLNGARLQGADLFQAKLQGADLSEAWLQGANLRDARLQGAKLLNADLQGASLRSASLQGAYLYRAELRGTNLYLAELQGAHLVQAELQGTNLARAKLQGADLSEAWLQGADLRWASLQGAELHESELQGADLRQAAVWHTKPPSQAEHAQADFKGLVLEEPSPDELDELEKMIGEVADTDVRARLKERLKPLLDLTERKAWKGSEQHDKWKEIKRRPRPDPAKLCTFLAKLACANYFEGYPVTGIALRTLLAPEDNDSRLDARRLANALLLPSCKGKQRLSTETKAELQMLADGAPAACWAPPTAPTP